MPNCIFFQHRINIFRKNHTNSDGESSVDVVGYGEAMIEVYIDGRLDSFSSLIYLLEGKIIVSFPDFTCILKSL